MPSSPAEQGLAVVCAPDGTVHRVVRATLEGAPVGDSFCAAAVDEAARDACTAFLATVTRGGFARSTPLRIGTRDVQCFGVCIDRVLRIVCVIDQTSAAAFAELVAVEDDPQFTRLAEEIRRTHSTYELYEELARVNNELVTAQRELARSVGELQRLNTYKDELLGMAAHDLRNPLHANAAYIAFLLASGERFGDDNLVLLDRLRSNSDYMLRLVENVLDFAAIQSGHVRLQLEEVPLESLALKVLLTMRILAEAKGVEIRSEIARSLPLMKLDRIKITQAMQNLLSNAVQYSPTGSVVDLRVQERDRWIEIAVVDRGPGIPPEELPVLFKPFTRLSTVQLNRQRSVGLGLAITKRLVEAHGGTIEVESVVGRGSTFTVKLPR